MVHIIEIEANKNKQRINKINESEIDKINKFVIKYTLSKHI